jgi:hypothetical protein
MEIRKTEKHVKQYQVCMPDQVSSEATETNSINRTYFLILRNADPMTERDR